MIYIIAITMMPLIEYVANNLQTISSFFIEDIETIGMLAISLISFAALICMIIKFIIKKSFIYFIIPYYICFMCLFYYRMMSGFLTFFLLSLAAGLICLSLRSKKHKGKIRVSLPILVWIIYAPSIIKISTYYYNMVTAKCENKTEEHIDFKFKHKPNIYYFLVDAYARQDTLKDMGFDNEPFSKDLEEMGFSVSHKVLSNYQFTDASLYTTMNLRRPICSSTHEFRKSGRAEHEVKNVVQKNGYFSNVVKNIGWWAHAHCAKSINKCTRMEFNELISNYLGTSIFNGTLSRENYFNIDELKKTIDFHNEKPMFMFFHLTYVHDASLDKVGNVLQRVTSYWINNSFALYKYIEAIQGTNIYLKNVIQHIKASDPNAVIIIQSDHGPIDPRAENHDKSLGNHAMFYPVRSKRDFMYRYGVLSAIYIPKLNSRYNSVKKYFEGKFSLVNTFRVVFSYLSDQEPKLLEDKQQFLYLKDNDFLYREEIIKDEFKM